MICPQCRKDFDVLYEANFAATDGTKAQIKMACYDCLQILSSKVEQFLTAKFN